MKRFRFSLEALLGLRKRKLQAAEAALSKAQGRRAEALERASALERRSAEARESLDAGLPLRGSDLRLAASSSEAFLEQARGERRKADGLRKEVEEARRQTLKARREVETLEKMRERNRLEWRRGVDREEEAAAAELFLARFDRGDNDDR